MKIFNIDQILLALIVLFGIVSVQADPVYQPSGPALVYGDVSTGIHISSLTGNPAANAAEIGQSENGRGRNGTLISLGAGLEYGNVDDLFDLVDEISAYIDANDIDPDAIPLPGQNPSSKINGQELATQIDVENPDFAAIIQSISAEVDGVGLLLAVLDADAYAKLHASADIPLVLGKPLAGGAWTMDVNIAGTSKAFSVIDQINFDAERARTSLETALNLSPGDPVTTFDLTGGFDLTIDPADGTLQLSFENDSLLLTRAAVITELSLGYGRTLISLPKSTVYWGVKAKYFNARLSRVSAKFGDITDSDELFDAIRDADFITEEDFGIDLGLLWVGRNLQFGATLTNINEPTFEYPMVDTSGLVNQQIIDALLRDTKLVFERQLKLESSLFSTNRRWTVNAALDVNPVKDPMQDDYQWATLGLGYATEKWWLPGARLGVRKNLAGSELTYLAAGITFLKFLNLDIASTLDTTKISGTTLPRGLIINLGTQFSF